MDKVVRANVNRLFTGFQASLGFVNNGSMEKPYWMMISFVSYFLGYTLWKYRRRKNGKYRKQRNRGQSNKNAKVIAGLYGIAVFVSFLGGLVVFGISTSNKDVGVISAGFLAGPASFVIVGLGVSLLSITFLKGKNLSQILVPLFCSIVAGLRRLGSPYLL